MTFAGAELLHVLLERMALAWECKQSGVGVSEVALGKIALLPGVHLGEGILPLQGQKTLQGPADSLSSARD